MRHWISGIMVAATLAGCASAPHPAEPVRFDLGAAGEAGMAWALPVGALEVQAVSWLAGTGIHYRLGYVDSLRRQTYAESRWVAPPGELLASYLARRHRFAAGGRGCRLTLRLDELEQRFHEVQASSLALEVRVVLSPAQGSDMLAGRNFSVQRRADGGDARAGVAAAREAANALGDEIGAWTAELARNAALAERCRN